MRRILALMLCLVLLQALTWFAAPLTRNTDGKAPAPSTLIHAKRSVTQEKSDGFLYCLYEGATDEDWARLYRLLLYAGYFPANVTESESNRMCYAYNIESSKVVMISYMPKAGQLIAAFPADPGVIGDDAVDTLAVQYEAQRPLPEAAQGRAVYPSFEAVTGAAARDSGSRSFDGIFNGQSVRYAQHFSVTTERMAQYLADLIALGYDIETTFQYESASVDYRFNCKKEGAELVLEFRGTIEMTMYLEPGVDWYELSADELSGLFGN